MKMLKLITLLLVSGCASTGHYEWNNTDTSMGQSEFNIDAAKCKMAAIKNVPIPSPTCTAVQKPDCPDGIAGAGCTYANIISDDQKCDKSPVKIAKAQQKEYRLSCLQVNGWTKAWVPNPSP